MRTVRDDITLTDPETDGYLLSRLRMVDAQVRPVGVSDPRLLRIMRELPRERFVPVSHLSSAYIDDDVPLGGGRVLTEPRVIARLIQLLTPRRGEKALVIGGGSGYAATILDHLGTHVTALEEDDELVTTGRSLTAEFAPGVSWKHAAMAAGALDGAPFDLILIDGAVGFPPHHLAVQLGEAGRLAGVWFQGHRIGRAFLAERSGQALSVRPQFDATTALLPGFEAPKPFAF